MCPFESSGVGASGHVLRALAHKVLFTTFNVIIIKYHICFLLLKFKSSVKFSVQIVFDGWAGVENLRISRACGKG